MKMTRKRKMKNKTRTTRMKKMKKIGMEAREQIILEILYQRKYQ